LHNGSPCWEEKYRLCLSRMSPEIPSSWFTIDNKRAKPLKNHYSPFPVAVRVAEACSEFWAAGCICVKPLRANGLQRLRPREVASPEPALLAVPPSLRHLEEGSRLWGWCLQVKGGGCQLSATSQSQRQTWLQPGCCWVHRLEHSD
jgi:hypothetical protein